MEERVYLGKVLNDYEYSHVAGEKIWLAKHSWDCDWYWGFGYVGNQRLHTHFDSAFLNDAPVTINDIFISTVRPRINQDTWWLVRDLFIQAYALKDAAAVYKHGGHQTCRPGVTDVVHNDNMTMQINYDLKIVLDKVWDILTALRMPVNI